MKLVPIVSSQQVFMLFAVCLSLSRSLFACFVWFLLFQIVKLCVFLYFIKFVICNRLRLLNSNLTALIHTQIIFEIGFFKFAIFV
jgi:hypothetical protein